VESRVTLRNLGLATLAFLPLVLTLLGGAPGLTPLALFPASVLVLHFTLGRLENAGWSLFGGLEPGLKVRSLGLAIFAFLPMWLTPQIDQLWGTILALFAAFVAAFYLVLQRLEKAGWGLFAVAASLAVLCSAINLTYLRMVGTWIGYQVFASVLDTGSREFLGGLSDRFVQMYVLRVAVLLALVLGLSRLFRDVVAGRTVLPSRLVGAVAMAIWLAAALHMSQSTYGVLGLYPGREIKIFTDYLTEVHSFVKGYRGLEHKFTGVLDRDKAATAVLVIGESARKDKLGIYGSVLETTPSLERFAQEHPDRLVVFSDAVAAGAYTRISVPTILSVSPLRDLSRITKEPSILKIMKSAGLEGVLISNQARHGWHQDFISTIMEDAARKTYLTESAGNVPDEALVPPLLAELARPAGGSKLIIVHLAGSHSPYQDRYPPNQAVFPPVTLENQYYNSLRYTDTVLQRIIAAVMEARQPVVLLYVSDHGEYLNDYGEGFYDHGNRNHLTRFEIEVPFLLTFNEYFLKGHASEIARMRERTHLGVSHDNVSHTLLGLMGVFDARYRPESDLGSARFVAVPRFIYDGANKITPLEKVHFAETRSAGIVHQMNRAGRDTRVKPPRSH
jgi:glucan phosphoethanolaminetransferase (alkaline phosphatase superfamily)